MAPRHTTLPIYLEIASKRVFAGSVDWPPLARSGRDEESSIEALFASVPRFARVLRGTHLGFEAPADHSALTVVERLTGNATTDFGAPDVPPSADAKPLTEKDLARSTTLLRACWRAFDRAAERAEGKELAKGPRGGGRDLDRIVDHVLGADEGYLTRLGAKAPKDDEDERAARVRQAVIDALEVAVREGVPPGPRGGKRWSPLLRPSLELARPRPCLGARGPDTTSMRSVAGMDHLLSHFAMVRKNPADGNNEPKGESARTLECSRQTRWIANPNLTTHWTPTPEWSPRPQSA